MTRKEIESLGWTECLTPDWLKSFGRYTPDRMWVIDKPMPSTVHDGFHKTYYLDYGMIFHFGEDTKGDVRNWCRFAIHKEATGGFGGGTTRGCIFAGRTLFGSWDTPPPTEAILLSRTAELRMIMIMVGILSDKQPKIVKSGDDPAV